MTIEIVVPRQGWSMEEGIFVEWLKRKGEYVAKGEMLFVLENDKAQQEVESFDSGLLHIPINAPQSGETVKVGQILGYLLGKEEKITSEFDDLNTKKKPGKTYKISHSDSSNSEMIPLTVEYHKAEKSYQRSISPRAARLALELNVNWREVNGTGRTGRVREIDILNAAERRL